MIKFLLKTYGVSDKEIPLVKESDIQKYFAMTGLNHMTLQNYKVNQSQFDSYLKFVIVRNPYDRLISAYNNLFLQAAKTTKEWQQFAGSILQALGKSNTSANQPRTLSFQDFLEFIIIEQKQRHLNTHWAPAYQLCDPCLFKFDAVLKFENLNEEFSRIWHHITQTNISLAHANKGIQMNDSGKQDYWAHIPKDLLRQIETLYAPDVEAFGYPSLSQSLANSWFISW